MFPHDASPAVVQRSVFVLRPDEGHLCLDVFTPNDSRRLVLALGVRHDRSPPSDPPVWVRNSTESARFAWSPAADPDPGRYRPHGTRSTSATQRSELSVRTLRIAFRDNARPFGTTVGPDEHAASPLRVSWNRPRLSAG